MKISVLGTGAIGGYYGMMLCYAGHDVHFLFNTDYDEVKRNGLSLKSSIHQNIKLDHVNAYKTSEDMPKSEIILVCFKTTSNSSLLAKLLPPVVDDGSLVILIQNGLGMEEDLANIFPDYNIAGGVARIASRKESAGHIIHQDHGNLDIGSYNNRNPSLIKNFINALNNAGVSSLQLELNYLRWKKLVWNIPFNGLSVILNKTTDQILSDNQDLKYCRKLMTEVIRAAAVCGVDLPPNYEDAMIEYTKEMRPYYPSMKLDYQNKRPMELEYMYQKPIMKAASLGFEMKETQKLFNLLSQLNG